MPGIPPGSGADKPPAISKPASRLTIHFAKDSEYHTDKCRLEFQRSGPALIAGGDAIAARSAAATAAAQRQRHCG